MRSRKLRRRDKIPTRAEAILSSLTPKRKTLRAFHRILTFLGEKVPSKGRKERQGRMTAVDTVVGSPTLILP